MTAQKMSAQEIIAFIGNAEKKTNVKVTFEWTQGSTSYLSQIDSCVHFEIHSIFVSHCHSLSVILASVYFPFSSIP